MMWEHSPLSKTLDGCIEMMPLLIILLPATACFCIATKIVYNIWFHPLAKFPGPKINAASVLPRSIYACQGRLPQVATALHDKYGHIVRIAPDELSFTSPKAWSEIYRFKNEHHKSAIEFPWNEAYGDKEFITFSGTAEHTRQRAHFAHAFTPAALDKQQELILSYVDTFIAKLKLKARNDTVVDISKWIVWLTFDIMGDLVFGRPFGSLADESTYSWITSIFTGLVGFVYAIELNRWGLLDILKHFIPKSMTKGRDDMIVYLKEHVTARLALGKTEKPDVITIMLESSRKNEPGMGEVEILGNADTLVIAGAETVAEVTSAAVFLLASHPEKLTRAREEVRGAFARDSIEEMNMVTINSRIPYLVAVLKETMRLHPGLPSSVARECATEGTVVDGHRIPAGTAMQMYHVSVFNTEQNWTYRGDFAPERWMQGEDLEYVQDNKDALRPFGVGPRRCMGQNLAEAETRLILAKLLWNFDIELQPGQSSWRDKRAFLTWAKKPLIVRLTMRDDFV